MLTSGKHAWDSASGYLIRSALYFKSHTCFWKITWVVSYFSHVYCNPMVSQLLVISLRIWLCLSRENVLHQIVGAQILGRHAGVVFLLHGDGMNAQVEPCISYRLFNQSASYAPATIAVTFGLQQTNKPRSFSWPVLSWQRKGIHTFSNIEHFMQAFC